MNQRSTLIAACVLGFLAVAIGAFGAHGLKDVLTSTGRTETFELAVKYQFYHALAMMGVGLAMNHTGSGKLKTAALLFLVGVVIFSGSLFVLSLTGLTMLGAVTPIGGLSFLAGWLMLVLAFAKK